MIFFSISKVLPFRDLRISLSFKGRISFLKPLLTSLLRFSIFVSLQMLLDLLFFSSVSACVLTQSRILPVTHAAKHTQLIRPFSRTCDTRSRTPGPAHQGERMVPCWGRFFRWRRWTWLLSTESRHSYTMGPFTHMSDSVADWGRGTSRVAPSQVGGPQNCDGSWFISVRN